MRLLAASVLAIGAWACNLVAPSNPGDAGRAEQDVDRGDAELPDRESDDADAARLEGPGPLTLVASEIEIVGERFCDLDGDGLEDNVVADLGEPAASLFFAAINSVLGGVIAAGKRLVFHFPWVDDRAAPSDRDAVVISFEGTDTDGPADQSDDFSGSESFYAMYMSLDACGEPLFVFEGARIDDGRFTAQAESVAFLMEPLLLGNDVQARGTLEACGAGAAVELCASFALSDLGDSRDETTFAELSMLEVLVAGGAVFGVPSVPGVQPDLDVDGDGLERVVLDGEGHVAACVDGDGTMIATSPVAGSECWNDPRIEDAFSVNVRIAFVGARFAGPEPGWEQSQQTHLELEPCTEPPAQSLWEAR